MTSTQFMAVVALGALAASSCTSAMQELDGGSAERLRDVLEIDHFYTYAPLGVSEQTIVAALRAAGLTVAERRFEFPEGGAGRYVYFDNAYLEILLQDPAVPISHADTRRRVEWERSGASPFGIAFHRRSGVTPPLFAEMRIDTVRWLDSNGAEVAEELRFLGTASDTLAPALFVVPMAMSYAQPPADSSADAIARRVRNRTHERGRLRVASVTVHVSPGSQTRALQLATQVAGFTVRNGTAPLLELTLSSVTARPDVDLRPTLPLVVRYR